MKKTNNKAILDSILEKKIKQSIHLLKESQKKWIQKTNMKKGELHKHLGIPEDQKLTQGDINKHIAALKAKYKDGKQYSVEDLKLMRELVLARNMMSESSADIMSENTNVLDDYSIYIYKNVFHIELPEDIVDSEGENFIGTLVLGKVMVNNKQHVFVDHIEWENTEKPEGHEQIEKDVAANFSDILFVNHIDK